MSRLNLFLIVMVGVLAAPGLAGAANCVLRNPVRKIYQIFPDATAYRTVVAPVDDDMKRRIERVLGSPLTQTDLDKHTAYVVLKGGVPIGFVHARTENGKRGSVELVWAMDLDLTIRDFRVQRSREKHTDLIKTDAFRETMTGRDLAGLRTMLTVGNDDVNLSMLGLPQSARSIAHCVVLCGIKTRIITELAFADSFNPYRLHGLVYRYFPDTAEVTKLSSPYPAAAEMARLIPTTPDQCDRDSFTVLRAVGPQRRLLGMLVLATWSAHPARPETWWAVSAEGAILDAFFVPAMDERTKKQVAALKGKNLAALSAKRDLSVDPPARCALEVLAVLATHGVGTPWNGQ